MAETEVAYLERRAATEAMLAQRAKCPAAIDAHSRMSKAYFESAEALKRLVRQGTRRDD